MPSSSRQLRHQRRHRSDDIVDDVTDSGTSLFSSAIVVITSLSAGDQVRIKVPNRAHKLTPVYSVLVRA